MQCYRAASMAARLRVLFFPPSTMHISLLCVLSLQISLWVLSEREQTDSYQWAFWSRCLFLREPGDLSDCPSFVAMSLPLFTNNRLRGSQQGTVTHSPPEPASKPDSQIPDSSLCVGEHRRSLLPFENALIFPRKMNFAGRGALSRPHSVSV